MLNFQLKNVIDLIDVLHYIIKYRFPKSIVFFNILNNSGLVTPYGDKDLGQHCLT